MKRNRSSLIHMPEKADESLSLSETEKNALDMPEEAGHSRNGSEKKRDEADSLKEADASRNGSEKLSDALDMLDEDLILRAHRLHVPKESPAKAMAKWGGIAACLCLLLAGAVHTLQRFDYFLFRAGCSALPGTVADGVYYYNVRHDGVYAYRPGGESEKLLSTFWEEGWQVNGYGLYYYRGKSLYVRPHETGKCQKLHTEKGSTHIRFQLKPDGNIILTAYNKHKELIWQQLLDAKTGDILETVMEPTPYNVYYKSGTYSDLNCWAGDRSLLLSYREEDPGPESSARSGFRLFENGKDILPEDVYVYKGSAHNTGDTLIIFGYRTEEESENEDRKLLIVLRPDGNDSIFTVQNQYYHYGADSFLFYSDMGEVWCLSLEDGSYWELDAAQESAVDFYDISTDGQYVYACAPWNHIQECWKVEYDADGKPAGLSLVDGDITD